MHLIFQINCWKEDGCREKRWRQSGKKTPFIGRKGHALGMLADKTTSSTVVWQITVNCSEASGFFFHKYCGPIVSFVGGGCLFGNDEANSGSHTWLGALGCIDYHSGHLSCGPFKAVEVNFFFFSIIPYSFLGARRPGIYIREQWQFIHPTGNLLPIPLLSSAHNRWQFCSQLCLCFRPW